MASKPDPWEIAHATCPNRDQHTVSPRRNYVGHSVWAEEMMRTHEQRECEGCGFWLIWTPKVGKERRDATGNG